MDLERRSFQIELRAKDDHFGIRGHAAVFNQLSDVIWDFRERIQPGAFAETIEKDDVRSLWNHDPRFILGRNKAGTLRLKEDGIGLHIENDFPETSYARDLIKVIERGDVSQMSFGFSVPPGGDDWNQENGQIIRTIKKAQLFDVSPVTFPAYPQTDVSARSLFEQKIKELRAIPEKTKAEVAAACATRRKFLDAIY